MSVDSKMTAIADTIRSYTGKSGKLGLDDMPGAINEAVAANGYDSGYSKGYADGEASGYQNGYAEGNEDGIADGKQVEYDRFWDAYQQNGSRTNFEYAFSGLGWTDETFKPKYDIKASNVYMMFRGCKITDLREEAIGVSMDFSGCTNFGYCFAYSSFKYLPKIDLSSAASTTSAFDSFDGTDLSLIVSERTVFVSSTFNYALKIINLTIEGTIAKSVYLQHSTKLSKASITSVINVLSSTTSGQTLTLSKTAVESAFGSTTAAEWTALVATKSNWTISLV